MALNLSICSCIYMTSKRPGKPDGKSRSPIAEFATNDRQTKRWKIKMKSARFYISIAAAAASLVASNAAHAEGFLAGLARDAGLINEDQRKALDGIHAQLGNPLDHAAAAGANMVVPGVGTAMEMNWQFQRMQDQMGGFSTPPNSPASQFGQQGGFPLNAQAVGFPQGATAFGNLCYTQAGVFGPGMPLPLGSSCNVMTQYGIVFGQIGR